MTAYWKERIQDLIDLARDRIHRLESVAMSTDDIGPPAVDTTQPTIEAERAMIARLQQTFDRLSAAG